MPSFHVAGYGGHPTEQEQPADRRKLSHTRGAHAPFVIMTVIVYRPCEIAISQIALQSTRRCTQHVARHGIITCSHGSS